MSEASALGTVGGCGGHAGHICFHEKITIFRGALMLKAVTRSKQGERSSNNEDSIFAFTSAGLFAVADGVGGGPAGEQASKLTVNTICQHLSSCQTSQSEILAAIDAANANVLDHALKTRQQGMACTLSLAWISDNQLTCFNIGDSRIYQLRQENLSQLTVDHIIEKKIHGRLKRYVTNVIGIENSPGAEITKFSWQDGDTLLLMSDGISDKLLDHRLEEICNDKQSFMIDKANKMIEEATINGNTDDKTIIIVF